MKYERELLEVLGNLSEKKTTISFALTLVKMIIAANVAAEYSRGKRESGGQNG